MNIAEVKKTPSICPTIEELTLAKFIKIYGTSLPHKVKICKGFYGVTDKTAVTIGDIYNVHYLKKTKVSGNQHTISYCMDGVDVSMSSMSLYLSNTIPRKWPLC